MRLEVWRGAELVLGRTTVPGAPVVLGPGPESTIPTRALNEDLRLLSCPSSSNKAAGFAVSLSPPLRGALNASGRVLRIRDGLLLDPRPEPLLLVAGDRGELQLGDDLKLRFTVVACRRRFRTFNAVDWRLGSVLATTATVALIATAIVSTGAPPRHRRGKPVRLIAVKQAPVAAPSPKQRPPEATPKGTAPKLAAAGSRRPRATTRRQRRRRQQRKTAERLLSALSGLGRSARPRGASPTLVAVHARAPRSSLDRVLGRLDSQPPRARARALINLELAKPTSTSHRPAAKARQAGPGREAIAQVVARGRGRVQRCYERQLLVGGKQLEGRILARWQIGPAGKAATVQILKDSVGNLVLRRCLTDAIKRWRFPSSPKRIAVVYPFEFFTNS